MKKKNRTHRNVPYTTNNVLSSLAALGLGAIFLGIIFCFVLYKVGQKPARATPPVVEKEIDPFPVIMSKLSKVPVKSRFSPVILYRTTDGQNGTLAGSGSVFDSVNGEQIITCEHLLLKQYGNAMFAWKKLRPVDTIVTRSISSILNRGNEILPEAQEVPDVVILKTGPVAFITCYSDQPESAFRAEQEVAPLLRTKMLTSLVSGEKVKMIGIAKNYGEKTVPYFIIDYSSIGGESGTGFVDDEDNLYVLKGTLKVIHDQSADVMKVLGNPKAVSFVYGPLHFNQ